jgi:GNAT superfamily N-acetyltransferase
VSPPVVVRRGTSDDFVAVMRLFDGALLDVPSGDVRQGLDAGDVLVAEHVDRSLVVGALYLDDAHVVAVAVRRDWRRRGVGTALVETAADRAEALTAAFDPRVREFYESLGFDVERRENRLWGTRRE